jgi:predicted transcriptional regulator/rubredoxin
MKMTYECKYCGQAFIAEDYLARHQDGDSCPVNDRAEELAAAGLARQEAQAWSLREAGLTTADVSGILGISENAVYAAWRRVWDKKEDAEELLDALDAKESNPLHEDGASTPRDRSTDQLEKDLKEAIRQAAEGNTVSAEEARKEFREHKDAANAADLHEIKMTGDDLTETGSESKAGMEPVKIRWECRCGYVGDTEEVWEHQENEMRICEASGCSGRQGKCDHCPEIATGDALKEPVYRFSDVRKHLINPFLDTFGSSIAQLVNADNMEEAAKATAELYEAEQNLREALKEAH